jgi:hypothetical protein
MRKEETYLSISSSSFSRTQKIKSKAWRSRKALSQPVSYAVLVWLNSLYSPVHLRSFSKNEKKKQKKTACPAKKEFPFVLQLLLTFVYLHCRRAG